MINTQPLIDKICSLLCAGGLTSLQCCQAENALTILCQPVFKVSTCTNLPNATTYNGRMVYVDDENKYYYAVQGAWNSDFSTFSHAVSCQAYVWGRNYNGVLGDNTTVNKSSPISVLGGFTDWRQVSAGYQHSLGLRTNGVLYAWGCNGQGRLGDNCTTNRSSPVSVVGFTDWCQAAAGRNSTLAVRTNGSAWAWGSNESGQLGDNTTVSKSSPVSVVGGFTDWCQISSGYKYSLALRSGGTLWAWGYNGSGRLGDNSATNRSSPVSVVGGFTDWCNISAGHTHSAAVRTNGTAFAWGRNNYWQIGNGGNTSASSPTQVSTYTDWIQVSAGNNFTLGVRSNGTAWGWGSTRYGQIGVNKGGNYCCITPASIVGGFTDWCRASAGFRHSLGVRTNGTAWAWGDNNYGQLGNNATGDLSSPVSVVGGFTNWAQVSAGRRFSLGRTIATVPLQSI